LAYVDEGHAATGAVFVQLLARLSVLARAAGTTNPDSPRHWLKVDTSTASANSTSPLALPFADNPSLPAYVAALAAEYSGLWRRRMIDARGSSPRARSTTCGRGAARRRRAPRDARYWAGADYGTGIPSPRWLLGGASTTGLYVVSEWGTTPAPLTAA